VSRPTEAEWVAVAVGAGCARRAAAQEPQQGPDSAMAAAKPPVAAEAAKPKSFNPLGLLSAPVKAPVPPPLLSLLPLAACHACITFSSREQQAWRS
jgi:hypothetical protein